VVVLISWDGNINHEPEESNTLETTRYIKPQWKQSQALQPSKEHVCIQESHGPNRL
jgi:hypothetical protein